VVELEICMNDRNCVQVTFDVTVSLGGRDRKKERSEREENCARDFKGREIVKWRENLNLSIKCPLS
jgi:hypothetical protein